MMILRHGWRRFAVCVVTAVLASAATATARQVTATDIKAAYLLNFIKFTSWPAEALPLGEPIVACIVGDKGVGDVLEELTRTQVDGRTVNLTVGGREILIRRLTADAVFDACRLLFWSVSNQARPGDPLHRVFKRPILTVSDAPGFATSGGIADLFFENGRLRFAVNPAAADRVQLRISSKLLNLAKIVKDQPNDHTR